MSRAFANRGVEVDYVFSGREPEKFFNMEPFGDYRCFRGMTLCWSDGRIDNLKTMLNNNLLSVMADIKQLDVDAYDLVITDFEPITAWAARLKNKASLGISHQYAFKSPQVPTAGHSLAGNMVLKHFAPAARALGFHWHHFNSPILPPLIGPMSYSLSSEAGKVVVYLPFEDRDRVVDFLGANQHAEFYYYCDVDAPSDEANIHLRPFGRESFQKDLASCEGVIANAGFGLLSESIQAGKKLLVKPLSGQMEQLSNAAAIEELEIGEVMSEFDQAQLQAWLDDESPSPCPYPDVADAIVQWIQSDFSFDEQELARRLWDRCQAPVEEAFVLA